MIRPHTNIGTIFRIVSLYTKNKINYLILLLHKRKTESCHRELPANIQDKLQAGCDAPYL